MQQYLNFLKRNGYSTNTITTYASVLKNYEAHLKDMRLVKKKLKKHFSSPNTALLHYNVLLAYLKWTSDLRFHDLKKMKLPPVPSYYLKVFSKTYLLKKTAFETHDSDFLKQKKATIKFLFETGLRASELYAIKEIKKDTLVIVGKGTKQREIFYNPLTYKAMAPFKYTTKTLRLWVKEILGQEFSPHSIRRSHATHMLKQGTNPKTVMMQLGHVKIETTFRYLQLDMKENQKQYRKYY